MRRWSLLALLSLTVGCSKSGGSPAAPSAPTPPALSPPIQPAKIEAVITDSLDYPAFDAGKGWTFAGKARNVGEGCAVSVRGTARFTDAAGTTLQTVEIALDASRRVQPAEVVDWQACCLTEAIGRAAGTVFIGLRGKT